MADPLGPLTLNSLATRGGKPIKKNGQLITRCECCFECPACFRSAGSMAPGSDRCRCQLIQAIVIVSGVTTAHCQNMDFPEIEPAIHATGGSVDGEYCLGLFNDWQTPIGSGATVWGNDKADCSGPADETTAPALLELLVQYNNTAPLTIFAFIFAGSAFLGEVDWFGGMIETANCNGPWTISNSITTLGDPDGDSANVGKGGTITIIPCCVF